MFQDSVPLVNGDNRLDSGGSVKRGHKLTLTMATVQYQVYHLRDSLYWDETDCLNYYGMLSLHEVFEIVGSQLTETDIEVLSFILNETYPTPHPLNPAGWTVDPCEGDPDGLGVSPSPELLKAWRRLKPRASQQPLVVSYKSKSGLELLLELERRGYLSDGNLEPLLELLRVLTRHDLLPLVSHKKRRTVSPERTGRRCGTENRESVCISGMRQTEIPLPYFTQQLRTSIYPPVPEPPARRRRKKRGNGWSRRPKKTSRHCQPQLPTPPPPPPHKMSCDIRLRVRAEYLEHESALRDSVSSDKQQPLERQFELFSRASSLLRARDLGSIICNIKFTELDNLEAFWGDYLSGALLEALKGVFITDSLRMAAGTEGVRLLIGVDQDDYEEGRRLLRAKRLSSSCNGGHTETR
ncbi:DNA-binding death effector domain-containing protein 2 isoform X1 [Solea senegalensis]|nr:death effector domain-containing 1 [Solea senegalensis]KAG7475833.1 DNA-binding death effector domain-containing protein 2 isoform X1 [Solea senegalensis]